jgi:putative NIF3 family GTP cyclohydrolase 1 type 2
MDPGRRSVLEGSLMTGREVVDLIKKNVGVPWNEQSTRDTFKVGNPDSTVKGIATTMMVTFGMLKRAHEAGLNMVISHEDTYWNDRDDTKDLTSNALYKTKTDYILKNDMIVWRMHDHMHSMHPDYTVVGELRSVGIKGGENADMRPGVFTIPETTLGEFASQVKRISGFRASRCVGDPKAKIGKILVGPGYATPRMTPEADVVIGGEQQEADGSFDNVEYVADAASLGIAKGLIMLGHVVSEQAGMEDMVKWLGTFVKGIPIQFVPAEEPFWT